MSKKKVSDFQVLDRIADANNHDGIVMLPSILRGNMHKKGGEVTFGVPPQAFQWFLNDTHHFVLYAINKEEFRRIKSEMEKEQDIGQ